jgi:exonuclease SbcD
MRFLHTADWHLGRLFHGASLVNDQAFLLDQFVGIARDCRPDVILVAGDIYDRAVPPPEAVALLDDVLSRLVIDLKLPVVLIAGNHDSPGRLHFASRLLAERRLYVTGHLPPACEPLVLRDSHAEVRIYSVPFAEPSTVRQCLECPDINDHNSAMRAVLDGIRKTHPGDSRSIVVAHAFVAGGRECESERPLSVGGAGTVDAAAFDGFHYTALGHLHSPQVLTGCNARYCGSLMSYSFDESGQSKGVILAEMDRNGTCACETISLRPRRAVRRMSGMFAEILANGASDEARDDYLEVTLTDAGPVLDAMSRLREAYPNVLHIARPEHATSADQSSDRPNVRSMDDAQLFKAFYAHVSGGDLTSEQEAAFAQIVDDLRKREREGTARANPSADTLGEGWGEGLHPDGTDKFLKKGESVETP